MKRYDVLITERLTKTVSVEAESRDEATEIAELEWKTGKHVLDADDFSGVEFEAAEPTRSREKER